MQTQQSKPIEHLIGKKDGSVSLIAVIGLFLSGKLPHYLITNWMKQGNRHPITSLFLEGLARVVVIIVALGLMAALNSWADDKKTVPAEIAVLTPLFALIFAAVMAAFVGFLLGEDSAPWWGAYWIGSSGREFCKKLLTVFQNLEDKNDAIPSDEDALRNLTSNDLRLIAIRVLALQKIDHGQCRDIESERHNRLFDAAKALGLIPKDKDFEFSYGEAKKQPRRIENFTRLYLEHCKRGDGMIRSWRGNLSY